MLYEMKWVENWVEGRPRRPSSVNKKASRSSNPTAISRSPSRIASASARSTQKRSPPEQRSLPHLNAYATNNHAERGLRGAVIYRKLSLGSQSERGERTIERLLSASITCRLRNQSLYAYLTQALAAHARGDPVPALT